ncbi:MAG TPA: hydantoinase B/oxoprolinase family protein [Acidobacteriota bacterium]|nr:hydantoinase B/oxoprolinase family protein [Acidobacteriota bacterium]
MFDPVELEIVRNILTAVAEEMGGVLQRTAFSPNIKERRDYSCAVFDAAGDVAVMADHMPVHLGSMPMSVKAALSELDLKPGDVAIVNDPFRGGTHLPDITLVTPIFLRGGDAPDLFVANRAHHSDVGGMAAGSMPLATEIYQEGLIIPPLKIVRAGEIDKQLLAIILANVRTPDERRGDLNAQIAANALGVNRLREIAERYGVEELLGMVKEIQDYAERITRRFISELADGDFAFSDALDDDGFSDKPVPIKVRISIRGDEALVDFTGSAGETVGGINANLAVSLSAVLYVFKAIIGAEVPVNSGILRPISLVAPEGSIVNARHPRAVAGGNVETSQRIVDVLLGALFEAAPEKIPAASAGTMNNVAFGGIDPRNGKPFAYYETIAGGGGAGAQGPGLSGRHSHMTNSLNTPIEALEHALPVRLERYRLRRLSGGGGRNRGGDGIERAFRFLTAAEATLLADRHKRGPFGLQGGKDGTPGEAVIEKKDGSVIRLASKGSCSLAKGDVLVIRTPGGGGFGKPA